jgi:folate-binding protein YgfZ
MNDVQGLAVSLPERGLIAVSGIDARSFLQGLITNDIEKVNPARAIYAGLLSPQGKYLFDFFIADDGARILFECEAARLDDLIRTLSLYRLRAEVEIEDISREGQVWALLGNGDNGECGACQTSEGGLKFVDPRLAGLGTRVILPAGIEPTEPFGRPGDYDKLRLSMGVPDGSRDIEAGRQTFLEANAKELNGLDFEKGCYVGQEVTARMNYRGTLKKRLLPVVFDGPAPEPGSLISAGERAAGDVRSGANGRAMALFRLEFLVAAIELEDGRPCTVDLPPWLALDGKAQTSPS